MSDSLSFNDVEADLHSLSEQLILQRNKVQACVEKLNASGFSVALSEEISRELLSIRGSLQSVECSQMYIDELIEAKAHVVKNTDHRNTEVMRYCLQQLARYISDLAQHKQDHTTVLITGFNEMAAMFGRPLLSERLLAVPSAYQVQFEALQQFQNINDDSSGVGRSFSRDECYLEFSQLVLSVYRGQNRAENLQRLGAFYERLMQHAVDSKAQSFWAACSAYTKTVSVASGELRPAVFKVFEQLEKIVMSVLADNETPVLGIQSSIDQLHCNVLCALLCDEYKGKHLASLEAEFDLATVLQILASHRELEYQGDGNWLRCSAKLLWSELQARVTQLSSDGLQPAEEAVAEYLHQIKSLKLLLMLSGVYTARDNLQEVEQFLAQQITPEVLSSCTTSLQLVEQQMLYQFDFLSDSVERLPEQLPEKQSLINKDVYEAGSTSIDNAATEPDTNEFGARCNSCIDVIQQALDTALGSSGNLIPDNSVISALDQLIDIVEGHGIGELAALLTPLSGFLSGAENTTLNQSDTLLVQEAIIAATLGIDSLVGLKPMPELVIDVTDRIETALSGRSSRAVEDHQSGEFFDSFLNEAEEMLPRLFELFQRWRGAPFGSSRLHSDISRLLHSFKHSAEEVNETSLSSVVHYLESTMLDLRDSELAPSQSFFDLAVESIEWLSDDIDRLRNNEPAADSSDLIDRLKLAGAVDAQEETSQVQWQASPAQDNRVQGSELSKDGVASESNTQVPGLVLVDDHSSVESTGKSIAESATYLQHADNCMNTLGRNHTQLVALQRALDDALKSANANKDVSQVDASQVDNAQLQALASDLSDIVQSQGSTLNNLGLQLGAAAQVGLDPVREALITALNAKAVENASRMQFKFESSGIKIQRNIANELLHAIEPLLCSLVDGAFESGAERLAAGKPELPTIELRIELTDGILNVELFDDGAGVTVHGAEIQSSNPWKQTARAGWDQFDLPRGIKRPTAWSNYDDTPIDITAMIDFAVRHGATVAVSGDQQGSVYRLAMPQLQSLQDVLVVEVQQQQFALLASQVLSVGLWSGEKVLSLAKLIGVRKKTAFGALDSQGKHQLLCKTAAGDHKLLVDNVIGHKSLEFAAAGRLLPDVPGYDGAAVVGADQIVQLLDIDYWLSQR